MMLFRFYLLGGLILHKALWVVMKRRSRAGRATERKVHSLRIRLVRAVKLVILLLLVAQVFLPDVLPILEEPVALGLVGGILYTLGLATALAGRVQLGASWSDIEVGEIAMNRQIVSQGVYRYIRHPIYVGDLLLLLGLELSLNSWLVAAAAALVPPVLLRAVQEEKALGRTFGDYAAYARRTKRFIPFVV
jgi:protein-S-isoprenylcysteine O-methyltransferase Ste14